MRLAHIRFSLSILFLFLIGLSSSRSWSQDLFRINTKEIDKRIGENWKGILFVCDPYCKFLAIREKNEWKPHLKEDTVSFSKIKKVAQDDPLYPLLIEKLPVFPYVTPVAKSGAAADDDEGSSEPPSYAVSPYGLTWSLDAGPVLRLQSVSSNTVLQSALAPKGLAFNAQARLTVSHGKPHQIFGQWVRHQLSVSMGSGSSYQTKDGESVSVSETNGEYQLWRAWPAFRTGPRLSWFSQSYTMKNESPVHFATDSSAYLFGWGFFWKRYMVALDTLVKGDIKESQAFRASPLDQSWYRLSVERCSADVSLFDVRFGFCGALSYTLDHQTASLAPNILVGGKSDLTISTLFLKATLRFGEDFYQ